MKIVSLSKGGAEQDRETGRGFGERRGCRLKKERADIENRKGERVEGGGKQK